LLGSCVRQLNHKDRELLVHGKSVKGHQLPIRLDEAVHNQLFSFSEYCAYYLIHLNTSLWMGFESSNLKGKYPDEHKALSTNRIAIRDYATVLACVPVYTMCDDHEVTDDWFFDEEWIEGLGLQATSNPKSVRNTSSRKFDLAQSIVADGLYAYGIFQGIGNAPRRFCAGLTRAGHQNEKPKNRLEHLLQIDWSFVAPTPLPAAFLDSRTQRHSGWNADQLISNSAIDRFSHTGQGVIDHRLPRQDYLFDTWLTSDAAIDELLATYKLSNTSNGFLFLVTAAPILSIDSVEGLKEIVGDLETNLPKKLLLDSELWRTNFSNYFYLVQKLLAEKLSRCLVLSGDVHYGYIGRAQVTHSSEGRSGPPILIHQLVSSPLLNEMEATNNAGLSISRFNRGSSAYSRTSRAWEISPLSQKSYLSNKDVFLEDFDVPKDTFLLAGPSDGWFKKNHFIDLVLSEKGAVVTFQTVG
jgi:hypothetical protein